MDLIESNELNNIFENITKTDKKYNNQNSKKKTKIPIFSNFNEISTETSNRTNPSSLHNTLLDSLNSKQVNIKSNTNNTNNTNNINNTNNNNSNNTNKLIFNIEDTNRFSNNKSNNRLPVNKLDNLSNLVIELNTQTDHQFKLHNCPNGESQQILYCIISAILPEFASYGIDLRNKNIKKIRERLAYDLDEKDLYSEYSYKKLFNKSKIQTILLEQKPIYEKWLLRYLSDYFNINICIIQHRLVVIASEYRNRPTILLNVKNKRMGLYTSHNNSIVPASLGNLIIENCNYLMEDLKIYSKYKMDELQKIAGALEIDITQEHNNKVKNRKKEDLYNDIKNSLYYL